MFSSRLPLPALIELCRAIRHQMDAGLTLARAMKQQGQSGPLAVRPVARRIAEHLHKGRDLKSVLEEERRCFPPLFLALSGVAEDTGKLPEVLKEMEDYFTLQVSLKRQFIRQITGPILRFVFAVLFLGGVIWLLGVIGDMRGPSPVSVMGMKGGRDALLFVGSIFGSILFMIFIYWYLKAVLERGEGIDRLLLSIPGIGGLMRALALSRFSMGMGLTMEAGVPVPEALRLSLNATNNAAYAAAIPKAQAGVEQGNTLTEALKETWLFPEEYLAIVETAEVSGKEPDTFERQAKWYHEEAARRMAMLATAAGWAVWVLVAAFIVAFILSMAFMYIGMIDQAASGRF